MPGNVHIYKYGSNPKEVNHFSQEQQSTAANHSRRTHSVVREPVTSIEHAMDIAIGAEGEPWDEEKEAA
jgi:hypothetical protein